MVKKNKLEKNHENSKNILKSGKILKNYENLRFRKPQEKFIKKYGKLEKESEFLKTVKHSCPKKNSRTT